MRAAAAWVLAASTALAQPRELGRDHPVRRDVARLYDRILAVTAGSRTAPELVIKSGEGPSEVAWYNFQGRASIGLGERAYKLCAAMGAHTEACIAFLLGHELAHFHHNDAWGTELAPLLDRQGITRTSIAEMEERADYFGILAGYAAGVDMRGAPERVLDAVYRSYKVTNPLYPTREQRLALAAEAERRASSMVPLFAAGVRLMLTGEPGWAARCFDAIGEGFVSREVINNQAAARLLEAIAISDPATVRFAYPVEVDARGRLSVRNTRGPGEGTAERRRQLLEQARDRLERAHQEDREYATYLVNLALAYHLLDQPEDALAYAARALRAGNPPGALVVRGIIRAQQGDTTGAKADLEAAAKAGDSLAAVNLEVLSGGKAPWPSAAAIAAAMTPGTSETIAGKSPSDIALALGGTTRRIASSADGPAIEIRYREHPNFSVVRAAADARWMQFLWTAPGYDGATSRGVKLGSPESALTAHGQPDQIIAHPGGRFFHFKAARLLVQVADGRVAGWSVYAVPLP